VSRIIPALLKLMRQVVTTSLIERGRGYIKKKWHDGTIVEFEAALALNKESVLALASLGEA
jgi:hypothetical protein